MSGSIALWCDIRERATVSEKTATSSIQSIAALNGTNITSASNGRESNVGAGLQPARAAIAAGLRRHGADCRRPRPAKVGAYIRTVTRLSGILEPVFRT